MTRKIGIEEELLLIDPRTRHVLPRSQQVIKHFNEHGPGSAAAESGAVADELDQELFLHQLETRTEPTEDLADARRQIVATRKLAADAAQQVGARLVACGMAPLGVDDPQVTRDDRYHDMVSTFGEIARNAGTCGMHVHVDIESPEEGVGIIDRIGPWLPLILALSVNSPFASGRDTGYASWRSQVWSRWPTAGPTERFGTLENYQQVSRRLIEYEAARDPGMLYFDARLSQGQPTVEIRLADVCTDPDDVILIACLVRALVETAARDWRRDTPALDWRAELLRAAQWRASRYGTSSTLLHPVQGTRVSPRQAFGALQHAVRAHLEENGAMEQVTGGIERIVRASGAMVQRAAFERSGSIDGVVDDLILRTDQSCTS